MKRLKIGLAQCRQTADFAANAAAILSKLDEADRTLLLLREVEGKSYEELAQLLGCTVQAIGPRLSRARERLRQVLHREAWL